MKKNCTLIATLPSLSNLDNVERVLSNRYIAEARFNTGSHSPYSALETLSCLKGLSDKYNKKLWIDIKGRQLRVAKWADPLYSCIEINHNISVKYPAKVMLRNGETLNLSHIKNGNKLFVDPIPRQAVGAGQSINIISEELSVDGYLTETDKEYLTFCNQLGLFNIMASFVESTNDLNEISRFLPNANIVSKIESLKGIKFIEKNNIPNLMAARDDLFLETGQSFNIFHYLKTIISIDQSAICASKIFSSLERREKADFADFTDLELMYMLGYRKFMLCDNICNYRFNDAIKSWEEWING